MLKEWDNLTPEEWKEIIDFSFETGMAWWKARDIKWFKDGKQTAEHNMNAWNNRHAGKQIEYVDPDGYVFLAFRRRLIRLHRLIWFVTHGYWPKRIDHINGDRADNRIENLREVSPQENQKNQKRRYDNKSGVTGVSFVKRINKWEARIMSNYVGIRLGFFDNFEDAVKVRKLAEEKYGFHKNHGMR